MKKLIKITLPIIAFTCVSCSSEPEKEKVPSVAKPEASNPHAAAQEKNQSKQQYVIGKLQTKKDSYENKRKEDLGL